LPSPAGLPSKPDNRWREPEVRGKVSPPAGRRSRPAHARSIVSSFSHLICDLGIAPPKSPANQLRQFAPRPKQQQADAPGPQAGAMRDLLMIAPLHIGQPQKLPFAG